MTALAEAEKRSRKQKRRYEYAQLVGTWQLEFVSGTKTQKTGRQGSSKKVKKLGTGRFIPSWIDVSITYGSQAALLSSELLSKSSNVGAKDVQLKDVQLGAVVNQVKLGAIALRLSGPTRYWPNTNSLGFDFVHCGGKFAHKMLYSAAIRGGIERVQSFADLTLKEQAFFTFFAVEKDYLAARGKGGGLALWVRKDVDANR